LSHLAPLLRGGLDRAAVLELLGSGQANAQVRAERNPAAQQWPAYLQVHTHPAASDLVSGSWTSPAIHYKSHLGERCERYLVGDNIRTALSICIQLAFRS